MFYFKNSGKFYWSPEFSIIYDSLIRNKNKGTKRETRNTSREGNASLSSFAKVDRPLFHANVAEKGARVLRAKKFCGNCSFNERKPAPPARPTRRISWAIAKRTGERRTPHRSSHTRQFLSYRNFRRFSYKLCRTELHSFFFFFARICSRAHRIVRQ